MLGIVLKTFSLYKWFESPLYVTVLNAFGEHLDSLKVFSLKTFAISIEHRASLYH